MPSLPLHEPCVSFVWGLATTPLQLFLILVVNMFPDDLFKTRCPCLEGVYDKKYAILWRYLATIGWDVDEVYNAGAVSKKASG